MKKKILSAHGDVLDSRQKIKLVTLLATLLVHYHTPRVPF
jgi:hypothetical protein